MTLPKPNLDDRTFEDLAGEARVLIPRYAPSWTDHNYSDPGITLAELFAWLTETFLYRLNIVTDRDRLKYLKLLGTVPLPPQAASVELAFAPLDPVRSPGPVTVDAGTTIYTTVQGNRIPFELGLPLVLTSNSLEKVLIDEKPGLYDRTDANRHADYFFTPFGPAPKKGCALCLGFRDASLPLILTCSLFERDLGPVGQHLGEPAYAYRNSELRWEYQENGKVGLTTVIPSYDGTRGFQRSGRLIFGSLPDWKKSPMQVPSAVGAAAPLYWLVCTVEDAAFEYPPRIESLELHRVPALHGSTLLMRQSTGEPDQRYTLGNPDPDRDILVTVYDISLLPLFTAGELRERLPITKDIAERLSRDLREHWMDIPPPFPLSPDAMISSFGITGDLAMDIFRLVKTVFTPVTDFGDSGSSDAHVVIDREEREIVFGDGISGRIPPDRSWIHVRQGGGTEGNLGPELSWVAPEKPALQISNPSPPCGGRAGETLKEAFERFLQEHRKPARAVTSGDFVHLARNTPGLRVAMAKAIPRKAPSPPAESLQTNGKIGKNGYSSLYTDKDSVTVIVIPGAPPGSSIPPVASTEFLNAVCRHLDRHRLLGTHVQVRGAGYVRVSVTASVQPLSGKSEADIKKGVIDALNRFLDPIQGGPDSNGWPIGSPVYLSTLITLLEGIKGVNCIPELAISGDDGSAVDPDGSLRIPETATVYPGDHLIRFISDRMVCRREEHG